MNTRSANKKDPAKNPRKAYNIKWDTDGSSLKECGLPRSVTIPDDIDEEDIADWLSDTYGFCHDGFLLRR